MTRHSKEELEKIKQAGQKVQEKGKVKKNFSGYFEESLMNALEKNAEDEGRNKNSQVKFILKKYLIEKGFLENQ